MKVSIITVCFNSELTIKYTINSVKSQDYPNIEHIIVDGGSIDSTLNIIESIPSHNSVLISEPDLGIYDAMNKGLDKATGDVVALLNSDDYYPRDNIISQIVDFFTSNPSVAIVFGNAYYVKDNDLTKLKLFLNKSEIMMNSAHSSAVSIKLQSGVHEPTPQGWVTPGHRKIIPIPCVVVEYEQCSQANTATSWIPVDSKYQLLELSSAYAKVQIGHSTICEIRYDKTGVSISSSMI